MEEILSAVANVGFPMAVSIFLLVRLEGRIEMLILCINRLSESITAIESLKG